MIVGMCISVTATELAQFHDSLLFSCFNCPGRVMYLCVCLRIRRRKLCHCYIQGRWWIKLDREVTVAAEGGCCEANELIRCIKKWKRWGDAVMPVRRRMARFVEERASCVCVCVCGRKVQLETHMAPYRRLYNVNQNTRTRSGFRVLSPTSLLPSKIHQWIPTPFQ